MIHRRAEELVEALLGEQVLDLKTAQEWAQAIQQGIRVAGGVKARVDTLGGSERPSIMILIVWDPKETWANGIMENARYARFHIHHDGTLEMFAGGATWVNGQWKKAKTFRKTRVKSLDDTISKLSKYVAEAWS